MDSGENSKPPQQVIFDQPGLYQKEKAAYAAFSHPCLKRYCRFILMHSCGNLHQLQSQFRK